MVLVFEKANVEARMLRDRPGESVRWDTQRVFHRARRSCRFLCCLKENVTGTILIDLLPLVDSHQAQPGGKHKYIRAPKNESTVHALLLFDQTRRYESGIYGSHASA